VSQSAFGGTYASAYDALYGDKDYDAECDLLEQVFATYAQGRVTSVLDLGCGTGGHALRLAQRGYSVTGVDVSPDMLAEARLKADGLSDPLPDIPPGFLLSDMRSLDLGRTFDAVVMMFAVLGYQVSNADVRSALTVVRKHLRPGGVFVCDVWYGPAVLTQRPGERVRVIDTADGQVIRVAAGRLDTRQHLCSVEYRVWRVKNRCVSAEARETHHVRYFFPMELEALLEDSGLELKLISAFPSLHQPVSDSTWNALVVGT